MEHESRTPESIEFSDVNFDAPTGYELDPLVGHGDINIHNDGFIDYFNRENLRANNLSLADDVDGDFAYSQNLTESAGISTSINLGATSQPIAQKNLTSCISADFPSLVNLAEDESVPTDLFGSPLLAASPRQSLQSSIHKPQNTHISDDVLTQTDSLLPTSSLVQIPQPSLYKSHCTPSLADETTNSPLSAMVPPPYTESFLYNYIDTQSAFDESADLHLPAASPIFPSQFPSLELQTNQYSYSLPKNSPLPENLPPQSSQLSVLNSDNQLSPIPMPCDFGEELDAMPLNDDDLFGVPCATYLSNTESALILRNPESSETTAEQVQPNYFFNDEYEIEDDNHIINQEDEENDEMVKDDENEISDETSEEEGDDEDEEDEDEEDSDDEDDEESEVNEENEEDDNDDDNLHTDPGTVSGQPVQQSSSISKPGEGSTCTPEISPCSPSGSSISVQPYSKAEDAEEQKRKVSKTDELKKTSENSSPGYCFCGGPDTEEMIGCEGVHGDDEVWYHYECAGIEVVPEGAWFCFECWTLPPQKTAKENGDTIAKVGSQSSAREMSVSDRDSPLGSRLKKSSSRPSHQGRKSKSWSDEENAACVDAVQAAIAIQGRRGIEKLAPFVVAKLREHGFERSPAAIKIQWNRKLRAEAQLDERRIANPERMRTSVIKRKRSEPDQQDTFKEPVQRSKSKIAWKTTSEGSSPFDQADELNLESEKRSAKRCKSEGSQKNDNIKYEKDLSRSVSLSSFKVKDCRDDSTKEGSQPQLFYQHTSSLASKHADMLDENNEEGEKKAFDKDCLQSNNQCFEDSTKVDERSHRKRKHGPGGDDDDGGAHATASNKWCRIGDSHISDAFGSDAESDRKKLDYRSSTPKEDIATEGRVGSSTTQRDDLSNLQKAKIEGEASIGKPVDRSKKRVREPDETESFHDEETKKRRTQLEADEEFAWNLARDLNHNSRKRSRR